MKKSQFLVMIMNVETSLSGKLSMKTDSGPLNEKK